VESFGCRIFCARACAYLAERSDTTVSRQAHALRSLPLHNVIGILFLWMGLIHILPNELDHKSNSDEPKLAAKKQMFAEFT
jgi:hypothetical protein